MVKKSTMQGRRKIQMTKIPNKSNLQVTFSKRRSGLFKKASELCTLCGVEIAILVFSPANKPFSFGHPGFDSVTGRFLAQNSSSKCCHVGDNNHNYSSGTIQELNVELANISGQLEGERKRGQSLVDEAKKDKCGNKWWESAADELTVEELESLKASMEKLKNNVDLTKQAHKFLNYDLHFENKPSFDQIVGNSSSTFPLLNYNFGFGNGVF